MAELARRQSQMLVPLLLAASLALLVLLAFNLRNLDPGAEELPPPVVMEPTSTAGVAEVSGAPLQALFVASIVVLVTVTVVGSLLLWRHGVKPWKLVSVWDILGYVLAVVFIVSIFLFFNQIHAGLEALARWVTGSRDSGGGGTGTPPQLPFGTDPPTLLILVAVVIVTVYLIVFAIKFFPSLYGYLAYEEPNVGKSKRELARAVRAAIRDLEAGGDFRAAVLRCYGSMVLLFESRGMRAEPWQTAREFESDALRAAGVSREGVDDLTSLFEEARYSDHEIREAQRDAAIASLTAIREELEGSA